MVYPNCSSSRRLSRNTSEAELLPLRDRFLGVSSFFFGVSFSSCFFSCSSFTFEASESAVFLVPTFSFFVGGSLFSQESSSTSLPFAAWVGCCCSDLSADFLLLVFAFGYR